MSTLVFPHRRAERSDSHHMLNPLLTELHGEVAHTEGDGSLSPRVQRSVEAHVLPEGEIMSI